MNRCVLLLTLLIPTQVQAETPASIPVSQTAIADQKKNQGDFKGALAEYTQALAVDPKDVRAYLGRATVFSLQGNYAAAIADDSKAIALDPRNSIAYGNRGNARTAKGDLEGALADYTEAVTLDPHHVRAFLNRGNINNLQKKYAAAIDDYTTALALDPKNAAAYYNRAGAHRALGQYADAAADYSKAIELNPVDVPAYLNRAVLELAQRNWPGAKTDLNKCLTLVPEERQAYPRIYLWVAAVGQGETKNAAMAELAPFADKNHKTVDGTWGWEIARYLTGKTTEVQFLTDAHAFQMKKNRGQKAQAFYYVGLERKLAGDPAGAAKYFHQCQVNGEPSLHEYILAREELKLSGASAQ